MTKNGLPDGHGEHVGGRRPALAALSCRTASRTAGAAAAGGPGRRPTPGRAACCSGMVAGQLVVAVGQHEHGRQLGDPAGQVPQHVQRGLVGPVHVLDDQHGRVPGPVQLGRAARRARASRSPPSRSARASPVPTAADQVAERPEGPRRAPGRRSSRPAAAPRPAAARAPPATRLDLPMPGLAADEHEPSPCPAAASRAAAASSASSCSRSRITAPATPRVSQRRSPSSTGRNPRITTHRHRHGPDHPETLGSLTVIPPGPTAPNQTALNGMPSQPELPRPYWTGLSGRWAVIS